MTRFRPWRPAALALLARSPRHLLLGALGLTLAGCGGAAATPPPPVERVAWEIVDDGGRASIVLVADGGTEYVATAGSPRPAAEQRFRVGSVTKTFTATIVLQLVEEGKLRLEGTLDEYLPGVVPQGDKVTLRHLLGHRSGLVNYTDFPSWLEKASRSSSTRPIDTLRFVASRPPRFAPGSQFEYSNSNYVALGLVIEKVTGRSYGEELEDRILEPLGLDSTVLATTRRLPGLEDGGENPQLPWAAGGIVSNAHDIARFFSALLSGRLVSDESLAEMEQRAVIGPSVAVGRGIFSTDLSCGRFWGHDGGILDYGTIVKASEDGDRVEVISARAPAGAPPDEAALLCPAA